MPIGRSSGEVSGPWEANYPDLSGLLNKNRERQQQLERIAELQAARAVQLQRLSELWDERFHLRQAVVQRINSHLSPAIRVSVSQFGNPERYQRLLEEGLKSARIKHVIVAPPPALCLISAGTWQRSCSSNWVSSAVPKTSSAAAGRAIG